MKLTKEEQDAFLNIVEVAEGYTKVANVYSAISALQLQFAVEIAYGNLDKELSDKEEALEKLIEAIDNRLTAEGLEKEGEG